MNFELTEKTEFQKIWSIVVDLQEIMNWKNVNWPVNVLESADIVVFFKNIILKFKLFFCLVKIVLDVGVA